MRRKYRDGRLYDRGGRFIWARVRDDRGKIQRLTTRCTDEEAATRWADEYERKAADPSYRRAAETTFGDALVDWLAELRRRKVSDATYEIAETKAGHFVRIWGEDWPILRVENDLVLRYIDQREREGVKPLTVKKELGALKGILEWARFRGTFPRDLATVIPPRYSGRHKPRTRWLPREEAVKLLRELAPKRAAQVAFILATGARAGESFRARREDVRLDDENPHVVIRGTKTEKATGTVPVTGLTHPYLIFALQHAPRGQGVLFDPWAKGSMARDIASACKRAGIARCSPNDLRRTFGKWHRLAGVTAEQVSVLLRHSTDTLAQTTYGQISGKDIGPALRQLVPVLYSPTAQTDQNHPNQNGDPMGNAASPAGLGPATPGLGNQHSRGALPEPKTSAERRSTGTRAGIRRAKKHAIVSDLYPDLENQGSGEGGGS